MFNYEEPKSPKSPILLPSKSLQKLPSFSTFSGMKAKTIVEEIHTEPISTKELLTIEKMTKGMHKAK